MENKIIDHSLDEYPEGSTDSKESMDFGNVGWNWPFLDGSNARGI